MCDEVKLLLVTEQRHGYNPGHTYLLKSYK